MESWSAVKKPTYRPKSGGGCARGQGQPAEGFHAAQIPERSVDPHKWM